MQHGIFSKNFNLNDSNKNFRAIVKAIFPPVLIFLSEFSAHFRVGSEAYPATYAMGNCSFVGVKRPGRGVDTTPSSAEVKERVELYRYSPSGPSRPVLG